MKGCQVCLWVTYGNIYRKSTYHSTVHKLVYLTHHAGQGRWLVDAPLLQRGALCAWYRQVWPPRSGPSCSPPSRCFQQSSPQPDPLEWPDHTGSPPQNWSGLHQSKKKNTLPHIPHKICLESCLEHDGVTERFRHLTHPIYIHNIVMYSNMIRIKHFRTCCYRKIALLFPYIHFY